MHWIQVLVETDAAESKILEALMLDLGALSVTLTDAADQPLFEPDPGETPLWNNVCLTALFDAEFPVTQIKKTLDKQNPDKPLRHKIEILEDKDWVKEWMNQFKPIKFSDNLWICPTWYQPPDPAATNIMLDPGLAFGTGTHPTTALCLEWLSREASPASGITDYGCGSGVLAIAGLLLGCDQAWATDIDPQALQATHANAELNHIDPERIQISLPEQLPVIQTDIVVANILAGPLASLATTLTGRVKAGGKIALSGILRSQTEAILDAYQKDFIFDPLTEREGWVILSATKKE